MVVRRMPLNKVPSVYNDNEAYVVVARVFVKDAKKDFGKRFNVTNAWQFKPSNKVRALPLDTIEDTIAYEDAFIEQLERLGRVEEFKAFIKDLENKFDIINLICECDNKYPGDYCHTESLLKLVKIEEPVKEDFDWSGPGYEIPDMDIEQAEMLRNDRILKRQYDKLWIAEKRRGD